MRKSDEELRDWYAGLAMQALFSVHKGTGIGDQIAEDAFEMAEIMMDRREDIMEAEAKLRACM
jgi:hypothetical protein